MDGREEVVVALAVFTEFETNLRKERQRKGIAAAKAREVYKGRLPTMDAGAVRRLAGQGSVAPRSPSSGSAGPASTDCSRSNACVQLTFRRR